MEVDLGPFNAAFPKIQRTQNIGEGATFLNRVLSNKMFQHDATGAGLLAEFLVDITAVKYPFRYHVFEFFLFPKQFISCSIKSIETLHLHEFYFAGEPESQGYQPHDQRRPGHHQRAAPRRQARRAAARGPGCSGANLCAPLGFKISVSCRIYQPCCVGFSILHLFIRVPAWASRGPWRKPLTQCYRIQLLHQGKYKTQYCLAHDQRMP